MDDEQDNKPIHVYVNESGDVLREIPEGVQIERDTCICEDKDAPGFECVCDVDPSEAMLQDNEELSMSDRADRESDEDSEATIDDESSSEEDDDEEDEMTESEDEDTVEEPESEDDFSDLRETEETDEEEEEYLDDDPSAPENLL